MYNYLYNTFWICLGLDLPNAGLWSKDACDSILRTTAQLLQADGRRGHEHRSWEQHGCHESCCLLISGAHRHSDRRWSFPTWYVANKSVYYGSPFFLSGSRSWWWYIYSFSIKAAPWVMKTLCVKIITFKLLFISLIFIF